MRLEAVRSTAALLAAAGLWAQPARKVSPTPPAQTVVTQYCVGCHNDKLQSGNVNLTKLDVSHPAATAELSEKVVRMLHAGMMPPPGVPRPNAEAAKTLMASIENGIDQAAAIHPNPGRPALHRMNRPEYANSIRDLLGVTVDVSALLPSDDMSHGFDNMADVLTLSPALDGRVHPRSGQDQPGGGGRAGRVSADAHLLDPARAIADAARGGHAVRNARRALGGARFSGGRRVRVQDWDFIIRPPDRCSG